MKEELTFIAKEAISQEEYDVARAEYASMKAQSQLIKAQIAKQQLEPILRKNCCVPFL
jgi:F0F1-type ATP synthase epsilon subunit